MLNMTKTLDDKKKIIEYNQMCKDIIDRSRRRDGLTATPGKAAAGEATPEQKTAGVVAGRDDSTFESNHKYGKVS